MISYILEGPKNMIPVDAEIPEPSPYEVRIKIAYTGVCASDISIYLGKRSPEMYTEGPVLLGHEPSGVIDKVGSMVTGLRVGDRVTCIGVWGCFSEYVVTEPMNVLKLHPDLSLVDSSIVEVLPSIAMTAMKTGITESSDVLIYGQGLTGLIMTRLVRFFGCKKLIVADLYEEKLRIAKEFGATYFINASTENVTERIKEIVPEGVDIAIIATRDGNDVEKAIDWTRIRGKIVNFGGIGPCDGFDYFKLHRKGLSVVKESMNISGVFEHRKLWRDAMELVADGILPTPRLRTHIFPMDQLQQALDLRAECSADAIHVLMENEWAREKRLNGEFF
ncbi:zinc-dependent alcohol dehydrogenase [Paenibacillus graminis]|uniref:zinc-dependent alcohol dehydrogenase n=2 Tax=Paenibacillus graminis TaxID=189425 RepID=UPI0004728756|nr:zinc-binding dehydrogenase [Paenibacillus graminis]MEC0170645.1 zinc-binding dehydrogenase [Paenibacillus graminis]